MFVLAIATFTFTFTISKSPITQFNSKEGIDLSNFWKTVTLAYIIYRERFLEFSLSKRSKLKPNLEKYWLRVLGSQQYIPTQTLLKYLPLDVYYLVNLSNLFLEVFRQFTSAGLYKASSFVSFPPLIVFESNGCTPVKFISVTSSESSFH